MITKRKTLQEKYFSILADLNRKVNTKRWSFKDYRGLNSNRYVGIVTKREKFSYAAPFMWDVRSKRTAKKGFRKNMSEDLPLKCGAIYKFSSRSDRTHKTYMLEA